MKTKFIFILIIISSSLFANKPRLYQFVTGNEGESYFIPEVINLSGLEKGASLVQPGIILSLYTKGVELSGGMYNLDNSEFSLSSDLYYGFFNLTDKIEFHMGLGGGLLFSSSLEDGFYSDIVLRFPFRFKYKDYFVKLNPMAGITMFEYFPQLRYCVSISFGYMFDFYKPPENDDKKLDTEKKLKTENEDEKLDKEKKDITQDKDEKLDKEEKVLTENKDEKLDKEES